MLEFIANNWETIFSCIGLLATICTAIVGAFSKFSWAEKIVKVCDWFSVLNTAENKEKIQNYVEKKKSK